MIRIVIFLFMAITANATTLKVGKGNFPSIKAAIEKAQVGDTILIGQGVYKEGNIVCKIL